MAVNWKEDWKKDLANMLMKFTIGALCFLGIAMLIAHGKNFLITLKPAYDVEYLLDNGAREGMHVYGEVPYTYDCFANMSDFDDSHVSAYYYALPSVDGMLILNVPVDMQTAMETLLDETMLYLDTGIWPTSVVPVEGYVVKAQGRLPYLLTQYMSEIGYTQEEIDAMGEPLMIEYAAGNLHKARFYAPVGMILLTVGILLIVLIVFLKRSKNSKKLGK